MIQSPNALFKRHTMIKGLKPCSRILSLNILGIMDQFLSDGKAHIIRVIGDLVSTICKAKFEFSSFGIELCRGVFESKTLFSLYFSILLCRALFSH